MALPEASVGLLPCGGGTQNLAWTVGEGWAKRIVLCGERVDANRAKEIGLAEEVVEKGEALSRALSLAERVGRQSPPAVSVCKGLIQQAPLRPHQQRLQRGAGRLCGPIRHPGPKGGGQRLPGEAAAAMDQWLSSCAV